MERLELLKTIISDLKRGLELYPENFDTVKTNLRIGELNLELNHLTDTINIHYNGNINKH